MFCHPIRLNSKLERFFSSSNLEIIILKVKHHNGAKRRRICCQDFKMEDINQADHLSKWLGGIKFPDSILKRIYHDIFFSDPEPFKCPLNNCNKQFFVMAELKNHVLDHYLIYRRKFEWFQRVKVVDDTEIYVIIYVDRATDTFLVRCDESVGRHNNQYIPSERLLPVIVPKINDIIGIDRENVLPTQRNYINSLELAIITEERTYDDGHSSWVVHSIKNKK